jgi:hypothetical protein
MRVRLFLAVFPLLATLAAPAYARSLDSILPDIRAAHPGRMSDAEPWTDNDGNRHYRIKWMTPEGRIIYFDADTRTGRYSSAGGDEGNDWRDRRSGGQDNRGDDENGRRDDRRNGNGNDNHRSHWNDDGGGGGNDRGDRHGHDNDGGDWHGGDGGHGDWGGNHHHGH